MSEQNDELLVDERFAALVHVEHPSENEVRAEERRKKLVTNLAPLVQSARFRRQRRVRRIAVASSVFAAAAAFALWLKWEGPPQVDASPMQVAEAVNPTALTVTVNGEQAEILHGSRVTQVQPGEHSSLESVRGVKTPRDGSASIVVPAGAPKAGLNIAIGSETELRLTHTSQTWGIERVALARGHLSLQVPKLDSGTSFVIVTPSVRVVVVGTAFSVTVSPEQSHDTCVRVSEGVVRVEALGALASDEPEARLVAGQQWGCEVAAANSESPRSFGQAEELKSAVPSDAAPSVALRAVSPPKESAMSDEPTSTLDEETALLAQAVRAEQGDNRVAAERHLKTLLNKYPHSPLVGEARLLLEKVQKTE